MKNKRPLSKYALGLITAGILCLPAFAQAQTTFYGFEAPDTVGTTPAGFTALPYAGTGVSNTLAYQGTQSLNVNTTGYAVNVDASGTLVATGSMNFELYYDASAYTDGISIDDATGSDYSGNTASLISTSYGNAPILYSGEDASFDYASAPAWSGSGNKNTWVNIGIAWSAPADTITYTINGGNAYTESLDGSAGIASFLFYSPTPYGDGFNVDNVSLTAGAIPEPTAWAMMAAGISMLAFLLHLRREKLS